MTITEYSKELKEKYNEHVILIKYGKFYRAFDYDAFIINYFFNYKISSKYTIGFPKENLNKVLMYLKNNSISSIVMNGINNYIIYSCLSNKYSFYLDKSLEKINFNESISKLNDLMVSKIRNNSSLFLDIRKYLENLQVSIYIDIGIKLQAITLTLRTRITLGSNVVVTITMVQMPGRLTQAVTMVMLIPTIPLAPQNYINIAL